MKRVRTPPLSSGRAQQTRQVSRGSLPAGRSHPAHTHTTHTSLTATPVAKYGTTSFVRPAFPHLIFYARQRLSVCCCAPVLSSRAPPMEPRPARARDDVSPPRARRFERFAARPPRAPLAPDEHVVRELRVLSELLERPPRESDGRRVEAHEGRRPCATDRWSLEQSRVEVERRRASDGPQLDGLVPSDGWRLESTRAV